MAQMSKRGVEYSTGDEAVAVALEDFSDRLLRLDQGMEGILAAVEQFPGEGSLHISAAFFWLFGQTPEAQQAAGGHMEKARELATSLNTREAAWLRALELWHARAFDASAILFEEITLAWPDDLLALRAAEFLYYVLGQQHSGARFVAHTGRLVSRHGGDPDFLAMHAFANELCGRAADARTHAERALELREVNPWAQHALEHVLLWEGNTNDAAKLMEGWLVQWPQVARTVHCHNAWHVALMHLDRLEPTRAFTVYDAHVWGKTPGFVVEQLDAIAFLWRAEMAGVSVDPVRWQVIIPHIRPVCETLFMPFATAHYAHALARAGEEDALESLLRVTERRASEDDAEAIRVWKPVGLSVVKAAALLGQGNAAKAAASFEPVMPLMTCIGGSDAQDDLFRFAYLDSLGRSGRRADAVNYLKDRLSQKQASPLEAHLLAGWD